mgnify:CR=1 FL=1
MEAFVGVKIEACRDVVLYLPTSYDNDMGAYLETFLTQKGFEPTVKVADHISEPVLWGSYFEDEALQNGEFAKDVRGIQEFLAHFPAAAYGRSSRYAKPFAPIGRLAFA